MLGETDSVGHDGMRRTRLSFRKQQRAPAGGMAALDSNHQRSSRYAGELLDGLLLLLLLGFKCGLEILTHISCHCGLNYSCSYVAIQRDKPWCSCCTCAYAGRRAYLMLLPGCWIQPSSWAKHRHYDRCFVPEEKLVRKLRLWQEL